MSMSMLNEGTHCQGPQQLCSGGGQQSNPSRHSCAHACIRVQTNTSASARVMIGAQGDRVEVRDTKAVILRIKENAPMSKTEKFEV